MRDDSDDLCFRGAGASGGVVSAWEIFAPFSNARALRFFNNSTGWYLRVF